MPKRSTKSKRRTSKPSKTVAKRAANAKAAASPPKVVKAPKAAAPKAAAPKAAAPKAASPKVAAPKAAAPKAPPTAAAPPPPAATPATAAAPPNAAAAPKPAKAPKKPPSLDHQRRQLLDTKTLPELKAMLKRNDQITTGTKAKLIKRIVDCVAKGALPRCPSCGLGRLKAGTYWDYDNADGPKQLKGFKCPGGYDDDEYVYCGFTANLGTIERPPWQFETPGGLV